MREKGKRDSSGVVRDKPQEASGSMGRSKVEGKGYNGPDKSGLAYEAAYLGSLLSKAHLYQVLSDMQARSAGFSGREIGCNREMVQNCR